MLSGNLDDFSAWSGLEFGYNADAANAYFKKHDENDPSEQCGKVEEVSSQPPVSYELCGGMNFGFVKTSRPVQWALRDTTGHQAVRVAAGKGSVTALNMFSPFSHRSLFDGDHAALFVAATQLHRGDAVVFLTEDDYPPLVALMWTYGAPAIVLFGAFIVLYLWRGAVRFGPTLPAPDARRRSMAEQIRGSGAFALKFGEGAPLHAAAVRALTDAANRRIPAYARLPRPQKASALGKATGLDGNALMAAIDGVSSRRARELPNALAFIESARRQLLNRDTPPAAGTQR
jgi:hypothetical protein